MRVFVVAVVLGLLLIGAPGSYAQDPPPAAPAPAAPAPAATAPQAAPVPFQDGLKYAYIELQRIASESAAGRAFTERIKALNDEKVKELQSRQKSLQDDQQRLESGGSVLSDAARLQLQREIERKQLDIQRYTEDAQVEVQDLTAQLQAEFEKQLLPILDQVARAKQLHMVFDISGSGLVWADRGMNLTAEVIAALNAGSSGASAAPSSAAPSQP